MNNDLKKILNSDTDGLLTYEYIAIIWALVMKICPS